MARDAIYFSLVIFLGRRGGTDGPVLIGTVRHLQMLMVFNTDEL